MKTKFYSICIFLIILTNLFGQENKNNEIYEIQKTLHIFQTGYSERDTSKALEWCNNIFYDNVEIIGTYSIHPESREWFTGKDKAVSVFQNDWIAWGDLEANIEEANINFDKNVAWVSFEAIITKTPRNSRSRTADESANNILNHIKELAEKDDGRPSKLKLLETAYYANLVLYQYEQGDEFVWPIRISGVLQKKDGIWKFRQMHFSHPNRGFPNVRNVIN